MGSHRRLGRRSLRRPCRHFIRLRESDPLRHPGRVHSRGKLSLRKPSVPLPVTEPATIKLQRFHLHRTPGIAYYIRVQGEYIHKPDARTGLRKRKSLLCRIFSWGGQCHHAV